MWDGPATGQLCACICICGICVCTLGLWTCLDDVSLYYTQLVSDRLSGLAQWLGYWPRLQRTHRHWLGCWPGVQCLLVEAMDYYDPGPKPGGMMRLARHREQHKETGQSPVMTQALCLDGQMGAAWADPCSI
jgi:hypothetical protein